LSRAESDAFLEKILRRYDGRDGLGWWAVEVDGAVMGDVVLKPAPFTEGIEVGYHFVPSAWGNGYATESSRRLMDYGFHQLELDRIVAAVAVDNERSLAVMGRLGLVRVKRIEHANLPHWMFQVERADWLGRG
jgi:RimJ/RimL family protein N-acetyltransferase